MDEQSPRVDVQQAEDGLRAVLQGDWIAADLTERGTWAQVQAALTKAAGQSPTWVLPDEMEMDHLGAIALWRAWGERLPDRLQASDDQKALIARVAEYACEPPPAEPGGLRSRVRVALNRVWERLSQRAGEMRDFTQVVGQVYLDLWRFAGNLRMGPWRDISSHLYRVGGTAMPITALVGFLIGVVLAYLMSQVLRQFGAEIFIVNILGLALIRELGPILAAVLIAGRSGSSITAQIGVMRVTEELDAMRVMGIPISYRLVMPRMLALALAMPLISVWTTMAALFGGMLAAYLSLDITPAYFLSAMPKAVSLPNLLLAVSKSVVFGIAIALIACHYGLRVKPNTESLGQGTTSSVVTAITAVILIDALFAILFKSVGI